MPKSLVVVESPAKARTISRFLGRDFIVDSSYGHIRDLPRSKLGVDVENNFAPQYVIPAKAKPVVKKLKAEAAKAAKTILAVDEDREGEAIAWHLTQALGLEPEKTERIVFHEITPKAIEQALRHPRTINLQLVDAQQARRILDRLVGYKLSPFLWKKICRGLSAGRVQSVAVRLVVEREREIQNFKAQEYWTIVASLAKSQDEFEATLAKIDGKALDKFALADEDAAQKIVAALQGADWRVDNAEKRATVKNPLPPFTTSTLQQDAFRRLGFSAKQTMMLAQQLYEGIELGKEGSQGLITYMRTDSLNLSNGAIADASEFIKKEFGGAYNVSPPRRFKTKTKGAQEAHEAIRPTDPWRTPESVEKFLDKRQYRLYDLIWRRFIATQMPAAIFDSTAVEIAAGSNQLPVTNYVFRATGQTLRFDGFLKAYPMRFSETLLPDLTPGEELELRRITPGRHFTEPPPRYSEATLVKTLEQYGIGRPSTYAPTISTIQERKYVERHERRTLKPTETGFSVNDLLVAHFPEIVDIQFTAKMEEELDDIATGKAQWQPVIREFYEPFAKNLAAKYQEVKKQHEDETTSEVCPQCGKPLVIKTGRFGRFLACTGFPECKYTKNLGENKKEAPQSINMPCPKCGEGEIVIRRTRKRGKIFYGCSRYPQCDYASWDDPRTPANNK